MSGDGPLVAQKAIISILKGSMNDVDIASQEVGVVSRVGDGIAYICLLYTSIMHLICIAIQFCIAGAVSKKNPLTLIKNQIPGYTTALGTQSSAATIPVNLQCAETDGVCEQIRCV